jgi:hypothetical protein
MSFVLTAVHRGTRLALAISYNLPPRGVGLLRGRVVARPYAQWCVRRMARDAELAMRSAA